MALIGVIADDFTGTASAGVLLAKTGVKTELFFDVDFLDKIEEKDMPEAIYVSSNSRHMSPENAYESVKDITRKLKDQGIRYYSKKIDTTLRGGIGYEIDAMLDQLGKDTVAVMVSAMPQSKRVCIGGYAIIDGVLLTETPVANDVKTPVKESYVPALISGQTKRKVSLIELGDVLSGETHLKKCLQQAKDGGNEILILDAITMNHIDTIAKCCVELGWDILAVDPGPFTMKLAYYRKIAKKDSRTNAAISGKAPNKTAILVVGSANPQTRLQMERLCSLDEAHVRVSVSPTKLLENDRMAEEEIHSAYEKIWELLSQENPPKSILIETALHDSLVNLDEEDRRHGYRSGMSSQLINEGLAEITNLILENIEREKIAGLLITGGDTMECVCRRIGVVAIQAIDNIVAQVDIGRIIGKYQDLPLIAKGGFCGYEDVVIDIVDRLLAESISTT